MPRNAGPGLRRGGDAENTLVHLSKAADHAIAYDTLEDGINYTALLVNRLQHKRSSTCKNYTENDSRLLLKRLSHTRYDFVRDNPAFLEIQACLEKYAS